jgi:formylglycine-generating enzyme required for sulfatase activity/tRNA A37 threonylcarbamoyladenosine biosynthesis protein TsaE
MSETQIKSSTIFSFFEGIVLTEDQKKALYELEGFILERDEQVFILSGYAGTGKTFLMKGVSKWLQELNREVVYTAPTGRASKVLSNSTGRSTSTMHRQIYKFTKEEENRTEFSVGKRLTIEDIDNIKTENLIYIVDEASMVGDELFDKKLNVTGMYYGSGKLLTDTINFLDFKSNPKTKLIFVGDEAQLPPVGMIYSPALKPDYLKKRFDLNSIKVSLTQIVRQNLNSDIYATSNNLRETLNQFTTSFPDKVPVKSGNDLLIIPHAKILEQYFNLSNTSPSANSIILAFSNDLVTFYNKEIRKRFFPNKEGKVSVGDVLVVGSNTYHTEPNLNNGEIIRVTAVGKSYDKIMCCDRGKKNEVSSQYLEFSEKYVTGKFKFREVTIQVRKSDGDNAELDILILEDWLESTDADFPWCANYLIKKHATDDFYYNNRNLYQDRKKYDFELAKFISKDKFANAVRCKFGYALTVHKAQGGEWDNVLVNIQISVQMNTSEYYRWVYTAITRAKKAAWVSHPSLTLSAVVPKELSLMQKLDKAIKINPNDKVAYNNRGVAYYNLKEYQKALNDFNKAIELDCNFKSAYLNRGSSCFNMKDYKKAIEDYDKAILLDPKCESSFKYRKIAFTKFEESVKIAQSQINKIHDCEPEMVFVQGGTFMMGSNDGYGDEELVHSVTLSDFHIGKYQVTQRLWKRVMGNNPSRFIGDDLPVERVSWDNCQTFIEKINQISDNKYRLPTEAEWEYAAKGGNKSKGFKYAGSDNLEELAWHTINKSGKTYVVGTKKANELGLFDMSENVWEWCNDLYSSDYFTECQNLGSVYNPKGSITGSYRVIRGGSWDRDAVDCRNDYRYLSPTDERNGDLGFRLVLSLQ